MDENTLEAIRILAEIAIALEETGNYTGQYKVLSIIDRLVK